MDIEYNDYNRDNLKYFFESKMKKVLFIFLLFAIISLNVNSTAEDCNNSVMHKIDDNLYKIQNILINTSKKEISFTAEFNMERGLIELILCGKNGKLHESVLETDIIPSYLQTALLLLGLQCGQNLDFQGQDKTPKGDSLLIYAEWTDSLDNKIYVRIEELVYNKPQKRKMKATHWIFLGSKFVDDRFMADIEESIITTYHDPFSIIDNPLKTGNDDTLYEVNSSIVPKKGTEVKIIIKSIKKMEGDK